MDSVAAFWEKREEGKIGCGLCPHKCVIGNGKTGTCRTRYNDNGSLIVKTHGRIVAANVDPVEKKPLNQFRPGTQTFSVATSGCNLVCPFCQNHTLSQRLRDKPFASPGEKWRAEEVVQKAQDSKCASISFTYSEPILAFEFALEVHKIAKPAGIDIVFVTNGQASTQTAEEMSRFLAAANVDLKSMSTKDYKDVLGGDLRATLDTIGTLKKRRVWVEVTTLIIPGFNDSEEMLSETASFIKGVDAEIPWHVSRFHPDYNWAERTLTPVSTLRRAREIGKEAGLLYVYTGNLRGDDGENTVCPHCSQTVIERNGYFIGEIMTEKMRCKFCGHKIAGIGFS